MLPLSHPAPCCHRWVWDCVFSADSGYLVTASSDMSARLWEVASGTAVRTYTGHAKAVTAVALNDAAPVAPTGAAAALLPQRGSAAAGGDRGSAADSVSADVPPA